MTADNLYEGPPYNWVWKCCNKNAPWQMRVPKNTDAHAFIVYTAATSSFFFLNRRNGIEFSQSRQTFMHTTKEGGIIFTLLFLAQQGHTDDARQHDQQCHAFKSPRKTYSAGFIFVQYLSGFLGQFCHLEICFLSTL